MSNVLPPVYRSRMLQTMQGRFVVMGALVVGISGAIACMVLVPAIINVRVSTPDISGVGVASPEESAEFKADIARTKLLLTELAVLSLDRASLSSVIALVYASRAPGVTIQSLEYKPGTPSTLTVTGTTQNRESVSAFRETLAKSERFQDVVVPVAALVGSLAGNFTVTLTGTF